MKTVLITGADNPLGQAAASIFSENDNKVFITGKDRVYLASIQKSLNDNVTSVPFDITDHNKAQSYIEKIYSENKLDTLVICEGHETYSFSRKNEKGDVENIISSLFLPIVNLAESAFECMKKSGGNIIFVNSFAANTAVEHTVAATTFAGSLKAFSKALSVRGGAFKIRVNSVIAGSMIYEGSHWHTRLRNERFTVEQYVEKNIPLKGLTGCSDVAEAAYYLSTAEFVSGAELNVDGGQSGTL